jgi:mono/diheme cytochrome c family protein
MPTQSFAVNRTLKRGTASLAALGAVVLGGLALTGCHTDMWVQPKAKPMAESDFFVDDQSSRPIVPHTVSREFLKTDEEYNTGWTGGRIQIDPVTGNQEIVGGQIVDKIPAAALKAFDGDPKKMLARGRDRFDIYCSPCHSRLGDGNGMIAQRGFSQRRPPGNYHTDRLRKMPIGHFYQVITEGYGVMYSYAARVETQDRWAIASYIRVLQKSQKADPAELRPDEIEEAGKNVLPPALTVPAGNETGLR